VTPKDRRRLLARYRITDGSDFRLADHDPADKGPADISLDKDEGREQLERGVAHLAALQGRLYAEGRHAVLAVFQAMDAAGKDGTIKHVMSGVNPQGVSVQSFKQPSAEALEHDFLWRIHAAVPPRGRIGIFNRSHYEDVLVSRVHPELLEAQQLPGRDGPRLDVPPRGKFWRHRLRDIAAFESYLARQGIVTLKFFLHVSREEQRQRLLARLDEPDKTWKFDPNDLRERAHWDDYQDAYEAAIAATASEEAPWFVVPADRKWFTHVVVMEALIDALEAIDPQPPPLKEDGDGLEQARKALSKDDQAGS
jgi:PPK2 family polyphosphate:nucleotide phosphotransferase